MSDTAVNTFDGAIRLQLHMPIRHRTNCLGEDVDHRVNDRFLVHKGPPGLMLFVYPSTSFTAPRAPARILEEFHYPTFVGSGILVHETEEWIFNEPNDELICEQLIRMVLSNDAEFPRYYANYHVKLPSGRSLGTVSVIFSQQ